MKDQLLIIGLVVAFAGGYLVGNRGSVVTVAAPPVNYDPARALAADIIKAQQDVSDRCYKQMVGLLERDAARREVTH